MLAVSSNGSHLHDAPPLLPENAPFTPEQRSWLNGFFAGLLGLSGPGSPTPTGPAAAISPAATPTLATAARESDDDEPTPWHDPAIGLDQRLELAKDRAPAMRLMAAMAQLDCGACGYLCKTYAQALDRGAEKDTTLCQPGGAPTARKIRELLVLKTSTAPAAYPTASPAAISPPTTTKPALDPSAPLRFDRKNPYPAPLIANRPLNAPGSAKDTRFISFDMAASPLSYRAGDALGVYPENCYEHVDALLRLLGQSGAEPISIDSGPSESLREVLLRRCEIGSPPPEAVEALARAATDPNERRDLATLASGGPASKVEGLVEHPHLIDLLARFPTARPTPQALVEALAPIKPRLYSISSSPRLHPGEVHLTVGVVRYERDGRTRKGVASTYLSDRVLPRQPVRVFVHPAHAFAPPVDPSTPMIMVGPGTGIAPFRAFLQERQALKAQGPNWLFFGDQHEATDFLYQSELHAMRDSGLLTHLTTAWSRDGDRKVYVQDRMREHGPELAAWIARGAHIYICGDASRMARDVHAALVAILAQHQNLAPDLAEAQLKSLAATGRYQRDVY